MAAQGIPKGHKSRNDTEWSFHSKELQRRHAPPEPCNPPRSALTKQVKVKLQIKLFRAKTLCFIVSGQQRNLGSRQSAPENIICDCSIV
jgi:hypothetical protein